MSQRQRRTSRRRSRNGKLRYKLLAAGAVLLSIPAIAAVAAGGWFLDVTSNVSLGACKPVSKSENSVVLAGDGSRLGYIASTEIRSPVELGEVPKQVQFATVAIEDQRFFHHGGADPEGIIRAAVTNALAGEAKEGGSTITQQLVRNLCIPHPEKTAKRKAIEVKLADLYFQKHSKREILGDYLNTASYGTIDGATMIGVAAASKIYFSKPVGKLNLVQSALLAGLPQAPSEYNPILNPGAAKARRNDVLETMGELGYISRARAKRAEEAGLELHPTGDYFKHREPFFFDYVTDKLIERYGYRKVRRGGLRVYTTLDPHRQAVADDAITSALPYSTDPASALVSIDPRTGYIKTMASSGNYDSSQFNLAAQGHRQPGSTFKMFVLTTAIKQGIDPYSTYYTSMPLSLDLPEFGHWSVHTADEGYLGRVNLQQATVASDNTVFAQLDLDVGPDNVTETAHSMGVTTELDSIPAEGLGGLRIGVTPLEMADSFATLASGGIHRNPIAIRKVVFGGGRVDHPEPADPKRVISPAIAYEVTRILHDNITYGTGTAAYTGCAGQAGKTGTTDNYVDAWFDGFQPNLATAVWVGYPESNDVSMSSVHGITVFGGTFPADIWNAFYTGSGVPCQDFAVPTEKVDWGPFFGSYTASAPYKGKDSKDKAGSGGSGSGGGGTTTYDPQLYAPGAGQEPAPVPPPPPASPQGVGGSVGVGN